MSRSYYVNMSGDKERGFCKESSGADRIVVPELRHDNPDILNR